MKSKILIATTTFGECDPHLIGELEKYYECVFNSKKRKLSKKELAELLVDVDGVIAGTEEYSSDVLMNAKKLKVISRVGVGTDNIDLDLCKERNIRVITTKSDLSESVGELILSLILSFYRNIPYHHSVIREKNWRKKMGESISGKILGIIGLGKIGKKLVELSKGFNFKILAYDINQDSDFAQKHSVEFCSMDNLLSRSEIVSINANSNDAGNYIISHEQIELMNSKTLIINTSRGANIDEDALYDALKNNYIKGACLDVFSIEPYNGRLNKLDNVILTPHIGGYTTDIRKMMEKESITNLKKFL